MSLSALVLMNGMLSGHFIPFRRRHAIHPYPYMWSGVLSGGS
jgi:hypothetical protein